MWCRNTRKCSIFQCKHNLKTRISRQKWEPCHILRFSTSPKRSWFGSRFSIFTEASKTVFVVWHTYEFIELLNDVINHHLYSSAIPGPIFNFIPYTKVEILGRSFLRKKIRKCCFRYNKNQTTWMVNMWTYFVNIHAHLSTQHTMKNSRVIGTIANNDEETNQYFILVLEIIITKISLWRLYVS